MLLKKKTQENNVLFTVNRSWGYSMENELEFLPWEAHTNFVLWFLMLNDQVLFLLKQNTYIEQE